MFDAKFSTGMRIRPGAISPAALDTGDAGFEIGPFTVTLDRRQAGLLGQRKPRPNAGTPTTTNIRSSTPRSQRRALPVDARVTLSPRVKNDAMLSCSEADDMKSPIPAQARAPSGAAPARTTATSTIPGA